MEKTWEEFYKSGKVTDYLEYRNSIKNENETDYCILYGMG